MLPERLGGSAGVNVLGTQCDFDRSIERKRERNCVSNEMRNLASAAFLNSLKQEVFEIVQFSFSIIRTMKTFKLLHVRYGKTSFVCTLVYQVATGLTITLYAWKSTSGRPTGSAGVAL